MFQFSENFLFLKNRAKMKIFPIVNVLYRDLVDKIFLKR